MNRQEEEAVYGKLGTKEHIRISRRDTVINDLKNSTVEGIVSFVCSIVALLIVLAGIFLSYRSAGEMGYGLGILMIGAFLFALAGVVLSIFGFRRKDRVRHYMERRGIILSFIVIAALVAVFVRGLMLFLEQGV